jgi:diguanylate cyclase (GGDEF)-like protein
MRLRFWLGLAAVLLIATGSVAAALIVRAGDSADFHKRQQDEANRSARQAEAVAALSVGQLAGTAAFFQAEGEFSRHEFDVVTKPLLRNGAQTTTAFIPRVSRAERSRYELERGLPIFERGAIGFRRAGDRAAYFPLTYVAADRDATRALGFDLGSDPERAPFLRRARDTGKPAASPVGQLLVGGSGIVVFQPIYRDGAPTGSVAQRRAALVGFAAGGFHAGDLAAAAVSAVPSAVDVQLRVGRHAVIGDRGRLGDAARAPIHIADRTWLLIVRDPSRPDIGLPILLAGVGISLAALLGALTLIWSRNERMEELRRQAGHDSLTGLKNRRRFEEDLRREMARGRREEKPGALLMVDLDRFKQVNDTLGHPAGDRLIGEIAGVLRSRMRETDVLARIGGDEFAIVLPHCDAAEAKTVADEIVAAVRGHVPRGDGAIPVTACVGIAIFGADPRTSFESVVSEADTAMYAAKDEGRDRVRVFDPLAVRGGA